MPSVVVFLFTLQTRGRGRGSALLQLQLLIAPAAADACTGAPVDCDCNKIAKLAGRSQIFSPKNSQFAREFAISVAISRASLNDHV